MTVSQISNIDMQAFMVSDMFAEASDRALL